MRKHFYFVIRLICFTLLLLFLVYSINETLTPKKFFDNEWPTTTTYKGFYQIKPRSTDVLFFGSSHIASGFIPQLIYNSKGIQSYNLGCEQQNMLVSYYWLKEALRYQQPKVVVLDTNMLFDYIKGEPLNTLEPCTRMAMCAMKWSDVKWEGVNSISKHDPQQTITSYIFTNIRFHNRWASLEEQDFVSHKMAKHYELKGYTPLDGIGENYVFLDFSPFSDDFTADLAEVNPLMKEYFDKIVDLCNSRRITLLLIKTPNSDWTPEKHNTVKDLAGGYGIDFIDFNEKNIYEDSGLIYAEEMHDNDHCNIWGAEKLTYYLAEYLDSNFDLSNSTNPEQWTDTNEYYKEIYHDCQIKHIDNINDYIDMIGEDRYTIMIASQGKMGSFVTDEISSSFRKLGLSFEAKPNESYCASIGEGYIYENHGTDTIRYPGSTRRKNMDYLITAVNGNSDKKCSILLANKEAAKTKDGINMVVYNNKTWKIVDSMCLGADGMIVR